MSSDFATRADQWLDYIIAHSNNPTNTVWGMYRCFDGYALAHFARKSQLEKGWLRFRETLDMIDANFAEEDNNPAAKWHLADFALHPLLRMHFLHRASGLEREERDRDTWLRFENIVRSFRWHFGDLTENHNLLHMAGRYLCPQRIEGMTFHDGRSAEVHRQQARDELRRWMDKWVTRGSSEWGADIYYNINLLALFNLADFAGDAEVQQQATAVLNLFMLEEAMESFAGAMVGAARRSYSCYRVDGRLNPSSPLHHLCFGMGIYNLNFIGAVIEAATSGYRVPEAIVRIAQPPMKPIETGSTHLEGLFRSGPFARDASDPPMEDHLGRHTWRSRGAMLSVMNSGGGRARYTEQVFQVTLGERAVVFANQPGVGISSDGVKREANLLDMYAAMPSVKGDPLIESDSMESCLAMSHGYWVIGNMPPGMEGDLRPGFWQGNHYGPRSYGAGPMAMCVYRIGDDALFPFVHAFFPRDAFALVRDRSQDTGWIIAQQGRGYVGVWAGTKAQWTRQGIWTDIEVRYAGPCVGLLCIVSDIDHHASIEAFEESLADIAPQWHADELRLSATPPGGKRVTLDYLQGPLREGQRIDTRGPRMVTPWGCMALGEGSIELNVDGVRQRIVYA